MSLFTMAKSTRNNILSRNLNHSIWFKGVHFNQWRHKISFFCTVNKFCACTKKKPYPTKKTKQTCWWLDIKGVFPKKKYFKWFDWWFLSLLQHIYHCKRSLGCLTEKENDTREADSIKYVVSFYLKNNIWKIYDGSSPRIIEDCSWNN